MRSISFLLTAFVMAFLLSCNQTSKNNQQPSFGPGGGNFDPQAFVDRQMDELKEGLQLTDDQEKKVREIITAGFETMQKAREEMQGGGGDFEGMREKMQQMREEQNQKIKTILSEEQWVNYEKIQEERRQRMRQNGGQGGQR